MKINHVARQLAICLAACAFWLGHPAKSSAIFHWLSKCCTAPAPYTYGYAGPFCNSGTQVNYLPTTAYRTTYVNVPVTTMRACQSVDPCTGCQVTALRPVTTIVAQPRLVPYNTYRLVYSSPATSYYGGASACCTTAAGYAPAYSSYPVSAPVDRGYDHISQPAIDSRAYAPAAPAYDDRPINADSTRPGEGAARSRSTFAEEEPEPAGEIETRKAPIHAGPEDDVHSDSGYRAPANSRRVEDVDDADEPVFVNPNNKTARRAVTERSRMPIRRASSVERTRHAPRTQLVEDDGWRPSNR